ncbi:MAG: tRNA (guanine(46)-N(7))-methyltransferase TrmB [Chlamydiia bacterium]|nr:tRNA (guanine(46)-N(7))-methyltransferase TrmB [Chlamydiia bacterium]
MKSLAYPYNFAERCVTLHEGVLFIPEYLPDSTPFVFPGWDALFPRRQPLHVEYCSGNGAWIVERAKAHPHLNWVAVEKRFDRVKKIWKKRVTDNLFIIFGEAYQATRDYFVDGQVAGIYVNFPDPWPKKRHAKHRLLQPRFIAEMARVLQADGEVCLVTDDPDYSMLMCEEMLKEKRFHPHHPEPYYTTDKQGYGDSFFDTLWREKGKTIRYHEFRREHGAG